MVSKLTLVSWCWLLGLTCITGGHSLVYPVVLGYTVLQQGLFWRIPVHLSDYGRLDDLTACMDFTDFNNFTASRRIMLVYLPLDGLLQSLVLTEEALTVLVQNRGKEKC